MKLPGLSIIFPYLDDAPTIGELCGKAEAAAREASDAFEIIVVDDGSRAEQARALDELARRKPALRVIRHEATLGYGAAIRSGIRDARLDYLFYTDGDGQYDAAELDLLWRCWNEQGRPDFVNGFKKNRSDPPHRRILGEAYRLAARKLFRSPIRDVNCDFRLIRSGLAKALDLRCSGGGFCLELVTKARRQGAAFAQVGVSHHPRRFGRSRFFSARNLAVMGAELLGLTLGR